MKTYWIACDRGAENTRYTTAKGETPEAALAGLKGTALAYYYDLSVDGEYVPPPPREYDDHNAKMRAADAMIDAMRPWPNPYGGE